MLDEYESDKPPLAFTENLFILKCFQITQSKKNLNKMYIFFYT